MDDPQTKLMDAFHFSGDDLQANREGYLTKQQRANLSRDRISQKISALLVLPFAPLLTLWAVTDGNRIHDTVSSRVGIVGLIWIVTFGIAGYLWHKKQSLDRDLHKGEVAVTEGIAQVGKNGGKQSESSAYFVRIEGLSWDIDSYGASAFRNGESYAIYYAPHSKTILSAEWLHKRDG